MIIFKLSGELSTWLDTQRTAGKSIGFAPTMGALHEGHLSLITNAGKQNDLVISSIFINPTQFNNAADFEKYPVSIEQDVYLLAKAGCDAVFIPSVKEIYPDEEIAETFDLGYLETILEGKFRPGHFQGVCQVVKKLLLITKPDRLYLGQKDFQQCMVIRRLIELMNSKTFLEISPTMREPDGLAMSSRNRRLSKEQRFRAPLIYECLDFIKHNIHASTPKALKEQATSKLIAAGFKVDYVEIASANDLRVKESYASSEPLVALVAAYLDDVRLIDNMVL